MRRYRKFAEDESGIALILVTLMLPVIVGFALLVIDMSRVNNLHFDLQKGADAYAIAGAAELDGRSDAITRSRRAVTNLVFNQYRFADDSTPETPGPQTLALAGVTLRFYESLPGIDNLPMDTSLALADGDADQARFMEVVVTPVGFTTIFPATLLGAAGNTMNVGASAVAGFGSAVCDFTPMFICNPYADMDELEATLQGDSRPMMLLKKQSGGNLAQYGPGNYGFLQTPDGDMGVPAIKAMFATPSPAACYAHDGVDTRPGNIPPVNDAINVRFDIYPNGNTFDPDDAPPAPNTIKGLKTRINGQNCSYESPDEGEVNLYKPVPRDDCFYAGTCAVEGKLGDGEWDRAGYWAVNHPSTAYNSTGLPTDASRYQVYNWEVDNPTDHGTELTAPACNTPSSDPDRRLIYVAIIDCVANEVQGSGGNHPVEAFASFFLTEPAGDAPDADIYGEIVDITGRLGSGTLENFVRDEAQLYR